MDPPFVRKHISLLNVVVRVAQESRKRAVDGVILAGFDLQGGHGETVVVVDREIDLTIGFVVAVIKLVTM